MDFWHDSAVQKRWLFRLTLFIGLLLVPVFVLAVFARPSADDYIYAARTHAVMQQYGFDLPRLLKAACRGRCAREKQGRRKLPFGLYCTALGVKAPGAFLSAFSREMTSREADAAFTLEVKQCQVQRFSSKRSRLSRI